MAKSKYGIGVTNGVDFKNAKKSDFRVTPGASVLKVDVLNQRKMIDRIKITFNATPPGVGGFIGGINTKIYSAVHGLGYVPAFLSYYQGPNFDIYGGGDRIEFLRNGVAPMFNGMESSEYTVFSVINDQTLDFYINHDTSSISTSIIGQILNLGYIIFASDADGSDIADVILD